MDGISEPENIMGICSKVLYYVCHDKPEQQINTTAAFLYYALL